MSGATMKRGERQPGVHADHDHEDTDGRDQGVEWGEEERVDDACGSPSCRR